MNDWEQLKKAENHKTVCVCFPIFVRRKQIPCFMGAKNGRRPTCKKNIPIGMALLYLGFRSKGEIHTSLAQPSNIDFLPRVVKVFSALLCELYVFLVLSLLVRVAFVFCFSRSLGLKLVGSAGWPPCPNPSKYRLFPQRSVLFRKGFCPAAT